MWRLSLDPLLVTPITGDWDSCIIGSAGLVRRQLFAEKLFQFGLQHRAPESIGCEYKVRLRVSGNPFTIKRQFPFNGIMNAGGRLFVVCPVFTPISQLQQRQRALTVI
jgi:hypothetical protein